MKKILTSVYYFFLYFGLVFAQSSGGTNPLELPNPLKVNSVVDLLKTIASYLLTISIPIATIIVIYGAFQILTAAGKVEQVEKGKKTILYAVIGVAVMLLADVLIALIAKLVGYQTPQQQAQQAAQQAARSAFEKVRSLFP